MIEELICEVCTSSVKYEDDRTYFWNGNLEYKVKHVQCPRRHYADNVSIRVGDDDISRTQEYNFNIFDTSQLASGKSYRCAEFIRQYEDAKKDALEANEYAITTSHDNTFVKVSNCHNQIYLNYSKEGKNLYIVNGHQFKFSNWEAKALKKAFEKLKVD